MFIEREQRVFHNRTLTLAEHDNVATHLFRVHHENGQANKTQNPQCFHLSLPKTRLLENQWQKDCRIARNSEETQGEITTTSAFSYLTEI